MGIWIAAGIATVLGILLVQWPIRRLSAPEDRRMLLVAFLIALPLQPLAFYVVRLPLHHALEATLGNGPLLSSIGLFYAPLTEEPAKWLVLLLPFIRRAITPRNALAFALAAGLGFGVGEYWFIASRIAVSPGGGAPFWMYGGFLVERLQTGFLHGAFILWFALALGEGRAPWMGGVIGMALHFACNLPIVVISLDPFGLGAAFWLQMVSLWLIGLTLALLGALRRLARREPGLELFGSSTCPECAHVYPRPIVVAVNLGATRLERCPACRHWHRVSSRPGKATA